MNATGSASASVSINANAAASAIGSVSGDFEIAATTTGTSIIMMRIVMSQEIEDIEGRNQVQRKKIQVRRIRKSGPR